MSVYLYPLPSLSSLPLRVSGYPTPGSTRQHQAGLGWAGGQQPCYHPPATHVVTPSLTTPPLYIHPGYPCKYMFHSLIILSRWTVTTPKNKDIFSNTAYGICHITWELCILYKSPYYNILLQSILMMSSLDQFMCVTSTIQNPQSSSGRGGQSVDAMMPRFPVQIYTSAGNIAHT